MIKGDFSRALLFIIFSSVGILSLGISVLMPEYNQLYELRQKIAETEQANQKIAQLIIDHKELISRIENDPNILKKLASATLGEPTNNSNTPLVRVTAQRLELAKEILTSNNMPNGSKMPTRPKWLTRCSTQLGRLILFIAGAGLIIVSFGCFCRKTESKKKKKKSGKS